MFLTGNPILCGSFQPALGSIKIGFAINTILTIFLTDRVTINGKAPRK
jgi:hypothetical protein